MLPAWGCSGTWCYPRSLGNGVRVSLHAHGLLGSSRAELLFLGVHPSRLATLHPGPRGCRRVLYTHQPLLPCSTVMAEATVP